MKPGIITLHLEQQQGRGCVSIREASGATGEKPTHSSEKNVPEPTFTANDAFSVSLPDGLGTSVISSLTSLIATNKGHLELPIQRLTVDMTLLGFCICCTSLRLVAATEKMGNARETHKPMFVDQLRQHKTSRLQRCSNVDIFH